MFLLLLLLLLRPNDSLPRYQSSCGQHVCVCGGGGGVSTVLAPWTMLSGQDELKDPTG